MDKHFTAHVMRTECPLFQIELFKILRKCIYFSDYQIFDGEVDESLFTQQHNGHTTSESRHLTFVRKDSCQSHFNDVHFNVFIFILSDESISDYTVNIQRNIFSVTSKNNLFIVYILKSKYQWCSYCRGHSQDNYLITPKWEDSFLLW